MLAVGLFAENPKPLGTTSGRDGLFQGGGWYLLGVQALTCVCLSLWSMLVTVILLWLINKVIPIRIDAHSELIGADLSEHKIRHGQVGISRALSALRPVLNHGGLEKVTQIGYNPGHDAYLQEFYSITHLNRNPTIYKAENLQDPSRLHDIKVLKDSKLLPILEGKKTRKLQTPTSDNFGHGNLLVFKNPDGSLVQQKAGIPNSGERNGSVRSNIRLTSSQRVGENDLNNNRSNHGSASRLAWLD